MSITVEALLNQKGIVFIPSGRDLRIKCLNPEHEDNDPSLRIDKNTGLGYCFSCGFKINIYKHFEVISDFQSVKVLNIKAKISRIWESTNGLAFPENIITYTSDFRGIKASTFEHFEAFTVRTPELENRIVFPIRDITGLIRCFIARHLYSDGHPRYLIKPEGVAVPLFPCNVKPINNSLILVEGIFDALNLYDKGITNVVCTFGTNTLHKSYSDKLVQYKLQGVTKLYIMFDADDAGQRAAAELKPLIESMDFVCELIDLAEGTDPGDLTETDVKQLKRLLCQQ